MWARLWRSRFFDVGEAETAFGRALLHERYCALRRQVPLLYAILLASFLGLNFASGKSASDLIEPLAVFALLAVVRLVHWLRLRGRALTPELILRELRQTMRVGVLLSLSFGLSSIYLYNHLTLDERNLAILFTTIAAIGSAYGLTSFPAAARLPLLLFAMPFAVRLMLSGNVTHAGVGISLALISLMVVRLVNLHDASFVNLVRSRSEVENERERAQRAEQVALAEKARVRQVADTDSLTGLANRRAFLAELEFCLSPSASGPPFALALLDLDGFKPVNDTFGHAAGDALLIQVAARLRREAGAGALVARIGGDEFGIVLPCADETAVLRVGERLRGALEQPYLVDAREFRVSACCGLTLVAPGDTDVTTALSQGDAALYSGKQAGRGKVALFTPDLADANRRRIAIERALREPDVAASFNLAFQPIFDLGTDSLRAFEALARWDHDALGQITPGEFIPITEQINVIGPISDMLLACACREAAQWPDAVRLSFNLSAIQLCAADSAERLLAIVAVAGVEPGRLQFEVTETAMLVDFATARRNLARLRAAGARVVLDDFGAGFASISYLREMIFDAIKLDGSLIVAAMESEAGERLLRGVLELCAAMNVPCVAEHIEQPAQLELLRSLRCREGQGYVLSPPLAPAKARDMAATRLMPFPAGTRRGSRHAA